MNNSPVPLLETEELLSYGLKYLIAPVKEQNVEDRIVADLVSATLHYQSNGIDQLNMLIHNTSVPTCSSPLQS